MIHLWSFTGVIICFMIFVIKNGSIVLGTWSRRFHVTHYYRCFGVPGDKSNHEMSFHAAQLLYFTFSIASGFSTSLLLPDNLYQFWCFISKQCLKRSKIIQMTSLLAAVLTIIAYCSPVHPFLLADNRHYTFYIWRKFFRRYSMAKFAPLAMYIYFGWFGFRELGASASSSLDIPWILRLVQE